MKNTSRKSRWTRVLAGLSAAVMVITSLGVMPVMAVEEPAATVIVPMVDFNSYSTLTIEDVNTSDKKVNALTGWSEGEPQFSTQNDTGKNGDLTVTISDNGKNGAGDKYFDTQYVSYTENEEEKKNTGVALNYNKSAVNAGMNSIALTEGQQLVYEVTVHSGKYFSIYDRRGAIGEDQTTNILNHLFWVHGGKLYVNDGTKTAYNTSGAMGYVQLPENAWADVKLVYTAVEGANNDTVRVYVNGELVELDGCAIDGVNLLGYDFLGAGSSRFTIGGGSTFDNFAVTKYDGIKYDDVIVPDPVIADIVPVIDFNDTTKWVNKVVETNGTWNGWGVKTGAKFDFIQDGEGDQSIKLTHNNADWSNIGGTYITNTDTSREGDQMVVSMKLHSGTNFYICPLVGTDKRGSGGVDERTYIGNLFGVWNGTFKHSNGGHNTGFGHANATRADAVSVVMPTDSWIDLTVVYTRKTSTIDADIYMNGYLVAETELIETYLMDDPIGRIEIGNGHFDDFGIKAYTYGAKFDPNTLDKGQWGSVVEVIPTVAMDANWGTGDGQVAPVITKKTVGVVDADGTTLYNDHSNDVAVVNYAGDTTENVAGKGKAVGDAYFMGASNIQYRSSNNDSGLLKKETGLNEGEQLVISFQALSSKNTNVYARFEGKRYVSTDNLYVLNTETNKYDKVTEKPAGIQNAVGFNNFNQFVRINGGNLQVLNGEPNEAAPGNASDDMSLDGKTYKAADDAIAQANLLSVALPSDQWVTVTMVYTAGAQAFTAGNNNTPEVVNVTKKDTVAVYVNNVLVLPETEMAENNLFRKIDRLDFQSATTIDNLSAIAYKGSYRFDPATIPGTDAEEAAAIGWDMAGIYVDAEKTAAALIADIKDMDGVANCTLINAAGIAIDGAALANTAAHAVVTAEDGKVYAIQIKSDSVLSPETTYVSLDGTDVKALQIRDTGTSAGKDSNTEYSKYGWGEDEVVYGFFPEYAENGTTWNWQRWWVSNAVNASSSANPFMDSTDMYISLDILHDGTEQAESGSAYLTLAGAPIVKNSKGVVARYGGCTILNANIIDNNKMVFNVNDGVSTSGGIVLAAEAGLKQWYNVVLQYNRYSKDIELYIDGEIAYEGQFFGEFIGLNNLYFNVGHNGFWVDNIVVKSGRYTPAPKADVDMTLPVELPEGYSWAEDGKTLNINKSNLNEEVASAYTTEDGVKIYIDAEGNVTEDIAAAEQIVVKATEDGSLHYYPIKARTGMARFDLGEDRWMIDVADGMGAMSETSKVYVARYEGKKLTYIKAYDVDAVDGDTWFVDVTDGIQKGDKVLIFSNSTTPVYKDTTDINVVCWGDSLTEGVAGNGANYPDELAKLIDYNVVNMGVAGESLITIAARSGALNIVLGEDLEIPSDRVAVDIALSSTELYDDSEEEGVAGYAGRIAPCNTSRGGWTPAEIIIDEDTVIEGRLQTSYDTDENSVRILKTSTFTRAEDGEAITAPAGSIIKVAAHDVEGDINIYWAGTNLGWDDSDLGSAKCTPENGLVALKKMILENEGIEFTSKQDVLDAEIPADAKFIVIGMTTGAANAWPGVNDAYAEAFGDHFLNVKEYLASEEALEDAGIEATDKDLEYIAAGKIPFSLLGGYRYPNDPTKADEVHLNGTGYKLLARQVYLKMMQLGY